MKEFFLSDCCHHENKVITSSFVVASKQVKPKKTGEPYLALILGDRTGQIEAKMWDNVEDAINAFEQDDFLKVKGLLNKYKNRFQITIHKLRRLQDSEVDFSDYLPKTTKDIGELWQTLAGFVATFRIRISRLWWRLSWPTRRSRRPTATLPLPRPCIMLTSAACSITWSRYSVPATCVCRNYPQINRDLLLTGAFLHDIGKIHELTYNRSFSYTTRGQLLGHMVIELEMLHAKLAQLPDFPEELKILIEHLIISHHGEYEFGSPKLPMFPEALMLHYLDNLDSKMESMRAHFEREAGAESPWAGYNSSLGRPLLNSTKFLEKKPDPPAAGAASDGSVSDDEAPTLPGLESPEERTTSQRIAANTHVKS